MSHTTQCKAQLTDQEVLLELAKKLNLKVEPGNKHRLYDGTTVSGTAIHLPNWEYPAIFDTVTGNIHYDNFNGRWGEQIELDKFMQSYLQDVTIKQAAELGYNVETAVAANGDVTLYCDVAAY